MASLAELGSSKFGNHFLSVERRIVRERHIRWVPSRKVRRIAYIRGQYQLFEPRCKAAALEIEHIQVVILSGVTLGEGEKSNMLMAF